MPGAYYNEIDPYCAQWLRNLIKAGVIANGEVDERDIWDVDPQSLKGFTQCHFFAGIGCWSMALRQAGWPDDKEVWTGSCPCQPFSSAGTQLGFADERHVWPAWFHLVATLKPRIIFGEQVASKLGLGWLDLVQTDLEAAQYAFGAVDFCAASIGAPHIRQRLYFAACQQRELDKLEFASVGTANGQHGQHGNEGGRCHGRVVRAVGAGTEAHEQASAGSGDKASGVIANAQEIRCRAGRTRGPNSSSAGQQNKQFTQTSAHANQTRRSNIQRSQARSGVPGRGEFNRSSWWNNQPEICCVDDGHSSRSRRTGAYGNAIVVPQAAEFIKATMEILAL